MPGLTFVLVKKMVSSNEVISSLGSETPFGVGTPMLKHTD